MVKGTQNLGVMGKGPKNSHVLFPAAPDGPLGLLWEALAYNLGQH